MFKMYFDGGKRKEGITFGFVILKDDEILESHGGLIQNPKLSSNAAEYVALIIGLYVCRLLKIEKIEIFGDSQLIINQVNGIYKCKSHILKPLKQIVLGQLKHMDCKLRWVPREQNYMADRLGR